MKTTISSPPPAPDPVDPGQSAMDYINAMADPALQERLLNVEEQFRPYYNALNLQDINQYLVGTGGQAGALDLFETASDRAAQIQAAANTTQRAADIADVRNLGGQATAAFREANPELAKQMERAQSLSTSSDAYAGLRGAIAQQPAYGNIQAAPAQATMLGGAPQVGNGQLGESLYSQALGASGLGQVGNTLQGRAQQFAQSTGQLTPDELRSLQQSVREGYVARGTEMGSGAISAEALSRLTNERQRMQEDLSMAAAINAQNQSELAANRGFAQGVQGADVSRQFGNASLTGAYEQANQAAQNQYGLYNSQADLAAQEANRAFQAQQYQQGIGNYGLLGQLDSSRLGADRAYALQLAQMQAATASDPFAAILGRQSGALQYGAGQQGFAGNLTQQMQGPQLFDPNAGINLALQNAANLGNYQAATYGAQAAGQGAIAGGLFQGLGALGGGLLGGGIFK